jgi:hypothetical protein
MLRKRRMDLGLLQREVAEMLSVNVTTVRNWGVGRCRPGPRQLPGVVRFIENMPQDAQPFLDRDPSVETVLRYGLLPISPTGS